jgi:hypothetical protein
VNIALLLVVLVEGIVHVARRNICDVVSTRSGVARFLPTGKVDATFGTGGLASAGFVGGEGLQGVALQPDGKIIWVGSQNTPGFTPFGTARGSGRLPDCDPEHSSSTIRVSR